MSKWSKGVEIYAEELKNFLADNKLPATEKNMLNGSNDWTQYSYGGSALIYDLDIAERLATPSEIKSRTTRDGGLKQKANTRETWLDVQARALYQASLQVLRGSK